MTHDHPNHDDHPQGEPSTVRGDIDTGTIEGKGIAVGHGAQATHQEGSATSQGDNRGQQAGINYGTMMQNVAVRLSVGIGVALILTFGILGASVIFNIGPLSPIAQDVWQQFFPPFEAAEEDESLIIVADFRDESAGEYDGVDPDQYIFRALTDRVQRDDLNIRVERLDETLDANTVRQAGEVYNATLVLWGQYDAVGITPYVERIKEVSTVRTDEEGQSVLVDPERIQFSVVTDLPAMSSYLVLFTLGADLRTTGQWDVAIAYLTSAIASVPDEDVTAQPDEAYFERGLAYDSTEQYENAVLDYTQAITLEYEPSHWPYNNRGNAYANLGEYEQAIEDYDRAIELDPEFAGAYVNLGSSYYSLNEYTKAREYYEQGLTLARDLDELQHESQALVGLGALSQAQEEYEQVFEYYEEALTLFRNLDDQEWEVKTLSNRGVAYAEQGAYERAIADFDRAIDLDPELAAAYINRGNTYDEMGEYEQAIADFDRAIDLDPELALAYINRGIAYDEMGEYEQAIADFDRAIDLDPEDATAYQWRGIAHYYQGNYERAVLDYDQAIAMGVDDFSIFVNRADAYRYLEQYAEALADYEAAVERENDTSRLNPFFFLGRGIVHRELGNTEAAIADFERVLELSDDSYWREQAEQHLAELRAERDAQAEPQGDE
jgi:tetratricopeptide (TPR) repeat protein